MIWHKTSDGPPVVPAGEHNVLVLVAQEHAIYTWAYGLETHWADGTWGMGPRADHWAYVPPPADKEPVEVLAERYLRARGWHIVPGETDTIGDAWSDESEGPFQRWYRVLTAVERQFKRDRDLLLLLRLLASEGLLDAKVEAQP